MTDQRLKHAGRRLVKKGTQTARIQYFTDRTICAGGIAQRLQRIMEASEHFLAAKLIP